MVSQPFLSKMLCDDEEKTLLYLGRTYDLMLKCKNPPSLFNGLQKKVSLYTISLSQ